VPSAGAIPCAQSETLKDEKINNSMDGLELTLSVLVGQVRESRAGWDKREMVSWPKV
jgi:hypothetical protein